MAGMPLHKLWEFDFEVIVTSLVQSDYAEIAARASLVVDRGTQQVEFRPLPSFNANRTLETRNSHEDLNVSEVHEDASRSTPCQRINSRIFPSCLLGHSGRLAADCRCRLFQLLHRLEWSPGGAHFVGRLELLPWPVAPAR